MRASPENEEFPRPSIHGITPSSVMDPN
jgi:hypothetical protein